LGVCMAIFRPSGRYTEQRSRAELLGGVGAGVLGAGLALLFRDVLGTLAVPFLALGATIHGLAMYQKHRLDSSAGTTLPRWAAWAYWGCWLLLLALAAYLWRSQR
jgi:hypothetical protein